MKYEKRQCMILICSGVFIFLLYLYFQCAIEKVIQFLNAAKYEILVNTGVFLGENKGLIPAVLNPISITLVLTGILENRNINERYRMKRENIFSLLMWCKWSIVNMKTPEEMREMVQVENQKSRESIYANFHRDRLDEVVRTTKNAYIDSDWGYLICDEKQKSDVKYMRDILWRIRQEANNNKIDCDIAIAGDFVMRVFCIDPTSMALKIDEVIQYYINAFYTSSSEKDTREQVFKEQWKNRFESIDKSEMKIEN